MPARLRIGVNALYLIPGGVGGTEIYLRNLLRALAAVDHRNEYVVYANSETDAELCPGAPNFEFKATGVRARFRPGRLLWEQMALPWSGRRGNLDVLFCPGFTAPYFARPSRVTVIHDLQHKRQPGNFGLLERSAWNLSVAAAVRSSEQLITVSENSRRDIESIYGKRNGRLHVIPHGVEPAFFGLRQSEDFPLDLLRQAGMPAGPYLLAVSTLHPHKNWPRLLEAFKRLRMKRPDLRLAGCGLPGKSSAAVQEHVRAAGLEESVRLLGWLPRRTVVALYKHAEALVFPSTFEGFGMPVAEALAAELPVVCSDIPPLREIADGCAYFFDPRSADELAGALERVLLDPFTRKKQVLEGRRRAESLTWTRAAERTLAVFLAAAWRR